MPLDDTDDVRYAKQRPAIPEPQRNNNEPVDKPDEERAVTLGEVQSVVDSLVKTIGEGFATKDDVNNLITAINGIKMAIGQSYPTREEAKEIARIAVPQTLRNLDNTGKRTGNVLLLSPGSARGLDASYWGSIAPSSVMPNGDEDNPHLIWNITEEKWEIGVIVPDGVDSTPYLKWSGDKWTVVNLNIPEDGTAADQMLFWDADTSSWSASAFDLSDYLPDGTAETPHLVWTGGAWAAGLIETLPAGGEQYQVLQRDGSGDAVWDWTRWA